MIKPSLLSHKKKEETVEPIHKILVNMLPQEIFVERQQSSKLALVNKISIVLLLVLIFFTSATLGLRFTQNIEFQATKDNLVKAEDKVSGLKEKELSLVTLKQRISSIQMLLGGDEKIKSIFNLVIFLAPPDIQITEATVDKNGSMSLAMLTANLNSLETFLNNLGNKEKNSGLISKVDMEGISLGRDGVFNFSLKLIPSR